MAFYRDRNDSLYFSSFRTELCIDEEVSGGLFEINKKRMRVLLYLLIITAFASIFSFIALASAIFKGWSGSDADLIYAGSLAFVPFMMLIGAVAYGAGGLRMTSLKKPSLKLSMLNHSLIFHIASLFISFNILSVFTLMCFGPLLKNAQEVFLISLINAFWVVYFIWSVRNVFQLFRGSSSM